MKRKGVFLILATVFLVSCVSGHAFTIPEWNQSEVREYVPAQRHLQNTEKIERDSVSTFFLGVEHIVDADSSFFTLPTPFLNDHGFLLLGMVLIPGLLKNVGRKDIYTLTELASAFAVGHGLALLSVYMGLIDIPGFLVESGIAFSVALIALERFAIIEDLREFDLRKDLVLLFFTGFWHGNGFVAVVENVQFPGIWEALKYLLVFTLGVDTGQIIFLGVVSALIFTLLKKFDETKTLKTISLLIIIAGTSLGLFRLLPVVGGVL